ncbi:MAG: hypothetical protein ACOYON_07750 [Fimbriimonas sp.]
MLFSKNATRLAFVLLSVVLLGIVGCGESSAPVSSEQKREMSSTPWGLFSGTGQSQGIQVQFDAGNEMTFTDSTGTKSGSYTMIESSRQITVDLNGQKQVWGYKRDGLNLELTFPDGRTGTFTMQ